MIRINPIELSIHHTDDDLVNSIRLILKTDNINLENITIIRRSLDARKKEAIKYSYMIDVDIPDEDKILKRCRNNKKLSKYIPAPYVPPISGNTKLKNRPVIVGFGPAGMFAALFMARAGLKPLVIERGDEARKRLEKVTSFWNNGILDTESNVSFGEGGAGTFSDGKLNTLVKDKEGYNRLVLKELVNFGAESSILYEQKPHIGTDMLINIVTAIRKEIIRLGGKIKFNTRLDDIIYNDNHISSIKLSDNSTVDTEVLILAIGHSSRDTFYKLYDRKLYMEAKAFAAGLRIEHPQQMIDISQFGKKEAEFLSPASYKLTCTLPTGRGVYTFCMCPGGYVVNASTENNMLAINGMSYHARNSKSANSAIIVTVNPSDFNDSTPLAGIKFQRQMEKKAYELAGGKIPVQLLGDFIDNKLSNSFGDVEPCFKGKTAFSNLREALPNFISDSIIGAMPEFDKKINGFGRFDAILAGVETRTSSPVRITRDESLQSNIKGIYPCGEGAGYAGGITSAAMDGIRIANKIISTYTLQDSF